MPYISGYEDGTVRLDNNITRAAAAIFFRLIADENKNAPLACGFTDVSPEAWYCQAVAYLASHGIIEGYPGGGFGPNELITRAEFAAMACRFGGLAESAAYAFPDVPETHWAAGYVGGAAEKGWVSGFPDGGYHPNDYITRAQAVAIINRMLERKPEPRDFPEDANKFTDIDSGHWAYSDILEASVEHEYTRGENGYEVWK